MVEVGDKVLWMQHARQVYGTIEAIAATVVTVGRYGAKILLMERDDGRWVCSLRWVPIPELALRSTNVPFLDGHEPSAFS